MVRHGQLMSQEVLNLPRQAAVAPRTATRCFHCGEPCPDDSFVLDDKPFCCFGCQTVFGLLRENGLEQFYQLQSAPGTRIRAASAAAKWKFLDDPLVQEKLFDFADQTRAKVTLHLPAIHCVACVWLLENLFKLHPGVGKSQVNFARREAAITFAPDKIKFSELAALLASIGYEPELTLGETEKAKPSPRRKKTWLQIGLAGFGFGNIMLMSLPVYFGLDSFNGPWFRSAGRMVEFGDGAAGGDVQRVGFLARGVVGPASTRDDAGSADRRRSRGDLSFERCGSGRRIAARATAIR